MALAVPHVFVSATTHDLGSYRKVVTDELQTGKLHPVVQDQFGPDPRKLRDYLRNLISECDAVICLVGFHHGSSPGDDDGVARSYTQFEYDVAIELNKPVFVFMATEKYLPDQPLTESMELRARQERHRRQLLAAEHICRMFAAHDEVRLSAAQAVRAIHELAGRRRMFYLHPPKVPAYFVGRHAELNELHAALREPLPAVVGVVGMGGQGKTTLVHQALRTTEYFPFTAGFWCTAYRTGFTFDMFLDEALAHLLRGEFDKRALPDVRQRVTRLISALQHSPALIVVDGFERWLRGWTDQDPQSARDSDHRCGASAGVDEFLAQLTGLDNGTHLILTTRALPAALDRSACRIVPVLAESARNASLSGLEPDAALDLLRGLGVDVDSRRDEYLRVAASYDYHPLALEVLGALLVEDWGGRLEKLPAVKRTDEFQSALDGLFAEGASAFAGTRTERVLHVAALCIENPGLTTLAAALGVDPQDADLLHRDIKLLARRSLISWDGRREIVSLHALVRQYFAPRAAQPADVHRRLVDHYRRQPVPAAASTLEHARPRLLAIEHALRAGEVDQAAALLHGPLVPRYSGIEWLSSWGHLDAGIDLLARLAGAADALLRLQLQNSRAALLRQLGRLPESLQLLSDVVAALGEAPAAPDRPRDSVLATAYANRANVYWQMSRFSDAVAEYDRALCLLEPLVLTGGASLVDLLQIRINRGHALHGLGDLQAALADQQSAAHLAEQLSGGHNDLRMQLAAARGRAALVYASLRDDPSARRESDANIDIYRNLIAAGREELRAALSNELINRGSFLAEADCAAEGLLAANEAVALAGELVSEGRSDLEPLLARGRMSLAHLLVQAGRPGDACLEADSAIAALERLAAAGRKDVRGWLSHALFNRAIARHHLGQSEPAIHDLRAAAALAAALLAEDEADMRIVRLRKSVAAARCFPLNETAPLMAKVLQEAIAFAGSHAGNEHLRLELAVAWRRLADRIGALVERGLPESLVDRWRELASA